MTKINTPGMAKQKCPMCGRKFVNGDKLNRHKRTCPAKND